MIGFGKVLDFEQARTDEREKLLKLGLVNEPLVSRVEVPEVLQL